MLELVISAVHLLVNKLQNDMIQDDLCLLSVGSQREFNGDRKTDL